MVGSVYLIGSNMRSKDLRIIDGNLEGYPCLKSKVNIIPIAILAIISVLIYSLAHNVPRLHAARLFYLLNFPGSIDYEFSNSFAVLILWYFLIKKKVL